MAKVLLVISDLRSYGGAEAVGVWLAHAFLRVGHNVGIAEVYDGKNQPITYELDPHITLHHINADKTNRLRQNISYVSREIKKIINQEAYSTCIYEGDYQSFLSIKATLTTRNCRFIHHDHGSIESQWGLNKTSLMRILGSRACDYLAVLTQQSKLFYQSHTHLAASKVKVMLNPLTKPVRQADLLPKGDKHDPKIVWAGRFTGEKGTGRIVSSTEQTLCLHPSSCVDIYGSGPCEEELDNLIKDSTCSDAYKLKGYASDMSQLYADYEIGIMTSDREGLPLFLIEAQSAGLPCIAYDVITGPREIIQDGVTGFLIEPFNTAQFNEKLNLLLSDSELRVRMQQAALVASQRFEGSAIVEAWELILK